MLSNDLSKRLMIRFKKSKDFYKLVKQLKKEGYDTFICIVNEKQKGIVVRQNNKELIRVFYEENDIVESEYKQNIYSMFY